MVTFDYSKYLDCIDNNLQNIDRIDNIPQYMDCMFCTFNFYELHVSQTHLMS